MKKTRKILLTALSALAILSLGTHYLQAKTTWIHKLSSYTYVKSYHPDNFFADTYTGTLSIKGSERYGDRRSEYPYSARITYDVQGSITRGFLYSEGERDTKVRTKVVTVKDKWNLGPKTKVFGEISLATAHSNRRYSDPGDKPSLE